MVLNTFAISLEESKFQTKRDIDIVDRMEEGVIGILII